MSDWSEEDEKEGVTYGIRIADGILSKIIRNLPIVNLFYTKKARLDFTRYNQHGAPCDGCFHVTRLPRWWMKTVPIKVANLHATSDRAFLYIEDRKGNRLSELTCKGTVVFPRHVWAYVDLVRTDI